jgi:transposase-like protein
MEDIMEGTDIDFFNEIDQKRETQPKDSPDKKWKCPNCGKEFSVNTMFPNLKPCSG